MFFQCERHPQYLKEEKIPKCLILIVENGKIVDGTGNSSLKFIGIKGIKCMIIYDIIRRISVSIPVIIAIIILSFMLMHIIPGSPAALILGPEANREDIIRLEHEMGLDIPLPLQLYNWFKGVLRGDLGVSFYLKQPVVEAIFSRVGITLTLATASLIIAIIIGLSSGILSALKQNSAIDNFIMSIAVIGISIPNFWLGINLMWFFGVQLRWLPVQGFIPLTDNFIKSIKYLILPSFCLGFPQGAFIARMTRSSMLEIIREDYIRTARAKGLKSRIIYMKHVFKNAVLPLITIIGMIYSLLLGGTILVENVFNIPGLGKLFIMAIQRRDYPLIQASTLYIGIIFILINLIADIIYRFIDPRIQNV